MAAETGISVLIVGIIFLFWMNGLGMSKKHLAIKMLFNLMSLWMTVLASSIAYHMSVADSMGDGIQTLLATLYSVLLWVVLFTTIYFVIMYVKDILLNFGWIKGKKKEVLDDNDDEGDSE